MRRPDAFSACHPAVNFLFFLLALGMTLLSLHPLALAAALLCAGVNWACLRGGRALGRMVCIALPGMALAALINPAFNHEGATVLRYLPSGNPLTLESLYYGLAAAALLGAAALWGACCTAVLTADKYVYLLGRAVPALSVLLSMTLRFVPRFSAQLRAAAEARRCQTPPRGMFARARASAQVLSATVTWSLEHAVETSDSMKGRGWGLPGRTSFSIYRMTRRDGAALGWMGLCAAGYALCAALGALRWRYYPTVRGAGRPGLTALALLCQLALGLLPPALQIIDRLQFQRSQGRQSL